MRTLGTRDLRWNFNFTAELRTYCCPVGSQSSLYFIIHHPKRLHPPCSLPIIDAGFTAFCFFHVFNNDASMGGGHFPGFPRGERRSRAPLLVSPLKCRFCNISHCTIVEQQYASQRQGKVPTLCSQTPGWWALVSPLLLGSLFLFPLSLLCHLFMTGARCHAILPQFWISLLLAILLGCPIHSKWATPVAGGELRGKGQGTLSCSVCVFPVIQRELFTIFTIMACVCGPDCVGVLRDAVAKSQKHGCAAGRWVCRGCLMNLMYWVKRKMRGFNTWYSGHFSPDVLPSPSHSAFSVKVFPF